MIGHFRCFSSILFHKVMERKGERRERDGKNKRKKTQRKLKENEREKSFFFLPLRFLHSTIFLVLNNFHFSSFLFISWIFLLSIFNFSVFALIYQIFFFNFTLWHSRKWTNIYQLMRDLSLPFLSFIQHLKYEPLSKNQTD